jgi:glycosyltransferase involved in cell wall biosynthesis
MEVRGGQPGDRAAIVIPAYEPTPALVDLVTDLGRDERTIIVIDDGSSAACKPIFDRLAAMPQVVVLVHAVNRGKGNALKTAFNQFLLTAPADSPGVVTADADGQHLPADVRRVAERLERSRSSLVLGGRTFEGDVPLRSRFGNTMTRGVVRLLLGRPIFDTQTGLRGIPRGFLPELVSQAEGGHYEFELEMLVQATRRGMTIEEIPIQTVYGGAGQSHFNPLRDSLRIYFVFLRFLGLSIATAAVDYTVFAIAFMTGHTILGAMAAARLVAGTFNFTCNRITVFKSKGPIVPEVLKYALLVVALMTVSYSLVRSLVYLGLNVYLSKVFAEGGLFIASFALQNLLVFADRRRKPE